MDWLFFAVLSQAVYTVVVYIDKYILEKEVDDYRGIPIYSAIVATVIGSIIWFTIGSPTLNLKDALLIILTGVLTIWGLAAYFRALSSNEASNVMILFQMTSVITLVLSFFLLGERISSVQFLGFLLILFSSIAISLKKKLKKIKLSNIFFLVLLTDFFWASAYVIFKFVVDDTAFIKVISYESWGIGLGGLILYIVFPSIRKSFIKTNKKVGKRIVSIIAINEGIFLVSRLINYLAVSLGPVALVNVAGGTQIFFAIFYGFMLTMIAPKIFKENVSREGLFKKITLAGMVLLGLWLIKG